MAKFMKKLTHWFNHLWYGQSPYSHLLRPFSMLYQLGQAWDNKRKKPKPTLLPVIVVGNLSVGGTGKTPIVIALCQFLKHQGYRVGIVTRGYQNQLSSYPHLVKPTDQAELIGDEAALIAYKTQVPVVIAAERLQAIEYLFNHQLCDIVLSDDGLQHYQMSRNIEIVVIDGQRGFGNGYLLPAGPLREPIARLKAVDFILINGKPCEALQETMETYPEKTFVFELKTQAIEPLFPNHQECKEPYAAFAGIGHPERFFETLRDLNIQYRPYAFSDHHRYRKKDFDIQESCIIMTEKDAIKCQQFQQKPIWVLPVFAEIPPPFWEVFLNSLG